MRANSKWPSACLVMLSSMVSLSSMFLLIVGLHVNRSFMQSVNYVEVSTLYRISQDESKVALSDKHIQAS